jgi:two-component sensor histidine kinase
VTFTRAGEEFCLAVEDDGVGFSDTTTHASHATSTGLGQRLIRSFAAQLGGSYEIQPRSPGTRAQVCFPVTVS